MFGAQSLSLLVDLWLLPIISQCDSSIRSIRNFCCCSCWCDCHCHRRSAYHSFIATVHAAAAAAAAGNYPINLPHNVSLLALPVNTRLCSTVHHQIILIINNNLFCIIIDERRIWERQRCTMNRRRTAPATESQAVSIVPSYLMCWEKTRTTNQTLFFKEFYYHYAYCVKNDFPVKEKFQIRIVRLKQ